MREPIEVLLEVRPGARFDLIDIRKQAAEYTGGDIDAYPRALYSSFHTTAGYFEQGLASRLRYARLGIGPYMQVFQRLFPAGAGYRHDDLDHRTELSAEQRTVEPRNADAHLAFIASGMTNCVDYVTRPREPVYFVDLDGVAGSEPRRRLTSVVAFHTEEVVARTSFMLPMSTHPIESLNLKEPRLGLYESINGLIARHGVRRGRVRLTLAAGERHAGLTINEYEPLLMRHDLRGVLRNPLRFVAEEGRLFLADPWTIPDRTIDYAKYDFVRFCNAAFDTLRISESVMEKAFARVVAATARHFLRMKRSVSLPISDRQTVECGALAEGTYQCPILVQWAKADGRRRTIDITLTRLR
jgi:thiamine phosphate synthase YjbQ (UPF0047 family)